MKTTVAVCLLMVVLVVLVGCGGTPGDEPDPQNPQEPNTFLLLHVGDAGMQVDDVFRVYNATAGTGRSYTAWTSQFPEHQRFLLSPDAQMTVQNLCRVINSDPLGDVACSPTANSIRLVKRDPASELYVFSMRRPAKYWSPAMQTFYHVDYLSRSSGVVTVHTLVPNDFVPGQSVFLDYGAHELQAFQAGWKSVLTAEGNTFTYQEPGVDTAGQISYVVIDGSRVEGLPGQIFPADLRLE